MRSMVCVQVSVGCEKQTRRVWKSLHPARNAEDLGCLGVTPGSPFPVQSGPLSGRCVAPSGGFLFGRLSASQHSKGIKSSVMVLRFRRVIGTKIPPGKLVVTSHLTSCHK